MRAQLRINLLREYLDAWEGSSSSKSPSRGRFTLEQDLDLPWNNSHLLLTRRPQITSAQETSLMALNNIILVLKFIYRCILTGAFSSLGIENVFQVLLSSSSNLLCMNHFPDALIIIYTFTEQMQRGRNTSLHLYLSLSVQS